MKKKMLKPGQVWNPKIHTPPKLDKGPLLFARYVTDKFQRKFIRFIVFDGTKSEYNSSGWTSNASQDSFDKPCWCHSGMTNKTLLADCLNHTKTYQKMKIEFLGYMGA